MHKINISTKNPRLGLQHRGKCAIISRKLLRCLRSPDRWQPLLQPSGKSHTSTSLMSMALSVPQRWRQHATPRASSEEAACVNQDNVQMVKSAAPFLPGYRCPDFVCSCFSKLSYQKENEQDFSKTRLAWELKCEAKPRSSNTPDASSPVNTCSLVFTAQPAGSKCSTPTIVARAGMSASQHPDLGLGLYGIPGLTHPEGFFQLCEEAEAACAQLLQQIVALDVMGTRSRGDTQGRWKGVVEVERSSKGYRADKVTGATLKASGKELNGSQ
eukprot:1160679-Pelagomonas_calceolata.AAC.6